MTIELNKCTLLVMYLIFLLGWVQVICGIILYIVTPYKILTLGYHFDKSTIELCWLVIPSILVKYQDNKRLKKKPLPQNMMKFATLPNNCFGSGGGLSYLIS